MSDRNFMDLLRARWARGLFVGQGLDIYIEQIPACVRSKSVAGSLIEFGCRIIDATHDIVCMYKPNRAFFGRYGTEGVVALQAIIQYGHTVAPNVPFKLDPKYGDIGNSNIGYVEEAFDVFDADAVTVHPYMGRESLIPFLELKNKGIFVLCKTSNPGGGEFQDLVLAEGDLLYQRVAQRVSEYWNENGNCGLVVGATYPAELKQVRRIVGKMPILIPGIGKQKGDLNASVEAGLDSDKSGIVVNAGSDSLYASNGPDYAVATRHKVQLTNAGIDMLRN